ncbi:MAG: AAA family ATPase [Planctomycetaceae bacterium]
MRFHRLTIEGFGPFAGEETIDFDRLGAAGLFLLAGPTGAGKTTILDAICYALYGQTTGEGQASGAVDGRTGAELRSAGAAAGRATAVTLAFSVAGRTWRVRRNPEYERPSRKGGGRTTREAAGATLFRATAAAADGWEPVADGVTDVTARIRELTGFTADQFRRVIVIPQNRFRDVLVSEPGAREELLKRIFGTDVYERFERAVAARRDAARSAKEGTDRERERLLEPHGWAAGLDDAAVAEAVAARIVSAQEAAATARQASDAAAARHTAASRELGAARVVATLATARAVAEVRDVRARETVAALAAGRAELASALAAREPARLLRELGRRERQQAAAIDAERAAETAAAEAARARNARTAEHAAAATAHAATTSIATRLGAISARLESAAETATRRAEAEAALGAAGTREAGATRVAEAARGDAADAVAARSRAEADLAAAGERFAAAAAARLAAGLVTDEPCPVCGSVAHPRPAAFAGDVPTDADLERLNATVTAARDREESARRVAAGAEADLAAARTHLAAARQALAAAPAAPDVTAIEAEKRGLEAGRDRLQDELDKALRALESATAAAADADRKLEAARATRTGCDGEVAAAHAAFTTALAATSFGSAAEILAAARDDSVVAGLERTIAAADQEASEAAAALASATEALGGRTAPDVARLEKEEHDLAAALARARAADEESRAGLRAWELLQGEHAALAGRRAAATAAFTTAEGLHLKVTGQAHPTDKVSLHRWVLGAVLEEVVAEATVMLRDMTRGRYELLRSESAADRKTRAGLDIDVFDAWHGTRRPARTLSGGETFLASLALSLALARIAERRAGGRRLETVFIDEGFGSLDAETLEFAMRTLASLRDQGRVVGVISHVDEMQRAIPVQLRVERTGDTSTTRIVGVGAAGG